MSHKSITIPFGMVTRRFYCYQCGQKLLRHSRTRTVRPGDPDYKEYAIRRSGNKTTFWAGDVDVTEYDFRCPDCNIITQYDKQLVIEAIQKNLGKNRLTQSEILLQEAQAEVSVNKKKTLHRVLWLVAMLALFAIALYFSAQTP